MSCRKNLAGQIIYKMVTASICTIGDELLIGQVVDTNSSMIAVQLNKIGVKVNSMVTCGDNRKDILTFIEKCLKTTEVVIVTGGLGPTKDDITKKILGELSGSKKDVRNKEQFDIIERILTARGVQMLEINKLQASVPETCTVIPNRVGTAPIMQFAFPKSKYGRKNLLFSMPGVPFETEHALPNIIASIKEHYKLDDIFHKTISTMGIPESSLAMKIEKWEDALPKNLHLAYLPDPILGVRLRLSIYGTTQKEGEKELKKYSASLSKILGDAIYSFNGEAPYEVIGKMLLKKKATISTAESCTGGFLAHLITSVPGASRYFYGSVISYDNSIKMGVLGVNKKVLDTYGAVSEQCVREMAEGVRKRLNTTYSIATSGIAGPGGGTKEKPLGTLWIAASGPKGTVTMTKAFRNTRAVNIKRFASGALDFFRLCMQRELI
jgi:nicotinamide-nucleotide amidase